MTKNTKFQLGNVLTVAFSHLVHDIYTAFLAPILPILIKTMGISYFQAGALDFVRKAPSLFNPYIGIIADKISLRYFLIIAPTITAIAMSFVGLASSYTVIVILIFIVGISNALFHVPAAPIIKRVSGDKIGLGMSFFQVGGELARTLGPLIVLGAVSLWTIKGTWRLIPFGLVASFILFLRLQKIKSLKRMPRHQEADARKTIVKLLPFFVALGGIILFRAAMKAALTIYLPTYLTQQGNSLWLAGISLSVLQLSGAAGTFLGGILSDKWGRKRLLLLISILNPILMTLFVISKGIWRFPVLVITGINLFGSAPILLALVQKQSHRHSSFLNGIYMTLNFVLGSIIIMAVGLVGDKIGLQFTYRIAAFLSIGTIPFSIMLMKHKNHLTGVKDG